MRYEVLTQSGREKECTSDYFRYRTGNATNRPLLLTLANMI